MIESLAGEDNMAAAVMGRANEAEVSPQRTTRQAGVEKIRVSSKISTMEENRKERQDKAHEVYEKVKAKIKKIADDSAHPSQESAKQTCLDLEKEYMEASAFIGKTFKDILEAEKQSLQDAGTFSEVQ
jgi:hypothetical protein